jgi:hypothetical protein
VWLVFLNLLYRKLEKKEDFIEKKRKYFFSWRYKIYFDYILLNNHRLSTVIFPSIQTKLYVTITIILQICKLLF